MPAIPQTAGRRRLVWVASYPKSGNTWTRLLLANFLADAESMVPINSLRESLSGIASYGKGRFDDVMGVAPGDCTNDEVEMLLPRLYRAYAAQAATAGRVLFCKAHDAFRDTAAGEPLFPDDVTVGAIYVVRNPLDVVVSSAFYVGHADFAKSIARLNDQGATSAAPWHFVQRLSDWSGHVRSWTTAAAFPVLTVRYEDLLEDTVAELKRIVAFLDLDGGRSDEGRLRRAVAFSEFGRLRESEECEGFTGNGLSNPGFFFRSGKAGDWRRHLSATQVSEVVRAHGETMAAFGYVPRDLPYGAGAPGQSRGDGRRQRAGRRRLSNLPETA